MNPVIVMPALNESTCLASACASLGFGVGAPASGTRLVLVDNGSCDDTREVMKRIAACSAKGTVDVVDEPVRGYISARVAGIEAARRLVKRSGGNEESLFVLQADADTVYLPGYVIAMVERARAAGHGSMIVGSSVPPPPPYDRGADFRDFEAQADAPLEKILSFDGPGDVVIDDKLAGFYLVDYDAWGGHRKEYTATGDEILAETTRLFMRAKREGAVGLHADDALAVTSQRRILKDPALAFATAGFPRDGGWTARWQTTYTGARNLGAFRIGASHEAISEAVRTRRRHLVALFVLLPACFAPGEEKAVAVLKGLGLEGAAIASCEPGSLLEILFGASDGDISFLCGD